MPSTILFFKCLVISPSDVGEERDAVKEAIHKWNSTVGDVLRAHIEPVLWESHAVPQVGGRPQELLNRQIVDQCDLGVAVFWSRLGTRSGAHESGSLEEISELQQRGAPVMVYFCKRPIPPEDLDTDQLNRLRQAEQELMSNAVVATYQDVAQLSEILLRHLTIQMGSLVELQRSPDSPPQSSHPRLLSAPVPDVRVKVKAMIAILDDEQVGTLTVSIENHSTVPVYHSTVSLELEDGRSLWTAADFLTGMRNQGAIIQPGDRVDFNFDPKRLQPTDIPRIRCAVALDKIGRVFRSDPNETREAIRRALSCV